jgi:plastocyanin
VSLHRDPKPSDRRIWVLEGAPQAAIGVEEEAMLAATPSARPKRRFGRLAAAAGMAAALLTLSAVVVAAADRAVAISGFSFSPREISVAVGDTVTWTNNDAQAHTASADDGTWDTSAIGNGASESITFATAGTFAYHCDIHPEMTGTIVVGSGLPPTDAALTATGDRGSLTVAAGIAVMVAFGAGFISGRRRFGNP